MASGDPLSINEVLRQFDPLTRLDDVELARVAREVEVLSAAPGARLLDINSEDTRQLFLLEGELLLTAIDGATHTVRADDPAARSPICRLRPSRYQVVSSCPVRYLMLDQQVLEVGKVSTSGMIVEESFKVSEPNDLLDDNASHPLMFDVFNDINLGRISIPSEPKIAIRVGHALLRLEDNLNDFVRALVACPTLSMKALRLARSMRRDKVRARTMRDAVLQLGTAEVYALSAKSVLRETLRTESPVVDERLRGWWERSMRIAAICRVLARSSERFDPDFAEQIGLFHAIAEPVMLCYADRHPDLSDAATLDHVIHGNRAEIGRILLSMWDMPRELVEAAAYCNRWSYDHAGNADYIDILLIAQWHAAIDDTARPRIPPLEKVPAFTRFGLKSLSEETREQIDDASEHAVERASAALND